MEIIIVCVILGGIMLLVSPAVPGDVNRLKWSAWTGVPLIIFLLVVVWFIATMPVEGL